MSLREKLEALPVKTNNVVCQLCAVLEGLEDEDRVALVGAINTPVTSPRRVSDKDICDLLRAEGWQVSANSVYRHRRNHPERFDV